MAKNCTLPPPPRPADSKGAGRKSHGFGAVSISAAFRGAQSVSEPIPEEGTSAADSEMAIIATDPSDHVHSYFNSSGEGTCAHSILDIPHVRSNQDIYRVCNAHSANAPPTAKSLCSAKCRDRELHPHPRNVFGFNGVFSYPSVVDYCWLVTRASHGLVDTGAETAVIGLHNFQRWMVCLTLGFGLKCYYWPLPPGACAGGVGGKSRVLAMADVPIGIAGTNGLERWLVLDDDEADLSCPPLVPNRLLIHLDSIIEPKWDRMTLRGVGSQTKLVRLDPSNHHTCSMLSFDTRVHGGEWQVDMKHLPYYKKRGHTVPPFDFRVTTGEEHLECLPGDERLDLEWIVEHRHDFITEEEFNESVGEREWCYVHKSRIMPTPVVDDNGECVVADEELSLEVARPLPQDPPPSPEIHVTGAVSSTHIDDHTGQAGKARWKKDEWRLGPNCWMRIHHRPRRALFIPTGTKDGPDIRMFSGLRSTKLDYFGSHGEIINDCWLQNRDRVMDGKWTGITYFHLAGDTTGEHFAESGVPTSYNTTTTRVPKPKPKAKRRGRTPKAKAKTSESKPPVAPPPGLEDPKVDLKDLARQVEEAEDSLESLLEHRVLVALDPTLHADSVSGSSNLHSSADYSLYSSDHWQDVVQRHVEEDLGGADHRGGSAEAGGRRLLHGGEYGSSQSVRTGIQMGNDHDRSEIHQWPDHPDRIPQRNATDCSQMEEAGHSGDDCQLPCDFRGNDSVAHEEAYQGVGNQASPRNQRLRPSACGEGIQGSESCARPRGPCIQDSRQGAGSVNESSDSNGLEVHPRGVPPPGVEPEWQDIEPTCESNPLRGLWEPLGKHCDDVESGRSAEVAAGAVREASGAVPVVPRASASESFAAADVSQCKGRPRGRLRNKVRNAHVHAQPLVSNLSAEDVESRVRQGQCMATINQLPSHLQEQIGRRFPGGTNLFIASTQQRDKVPINAARPLGEIKLPAPANEESSQANCDSEPLAAHANSFTVFEPDEGIVNDDVFLQENATLGSVDR